MQSLTKGVANTVTLSFRNPTSFSVAPEWELIDSNEVVLASGGATAGSSPNEWEMIITVPSNYVTRDGIEELTVELFGTDTLGKTRSVERLFNLVDVADDFLPQGPLISAGKDVVVSLIHDTDDLDLNDFRMLYQNWNGAQVSGPHTPIDLTVARVGNMTDVPDRFTDQEFSGFRYDLTFSPLSIPSVTHGPMMLQVNYGLDFEEEHILPGYPMTGPMKRHIINLKMFLDKARLHEIDPTLQWQTDELAHSVYEGFSYVNGFPDTLTYWTPEENPTPLHTIFWYAAAVYALNARYLAEGFNAFQFAGASTQLDFDRRDTITYKIEELKGYLDQHLERTKTAAIRTFGIGTPTAEDISSGTNNLGYLGLHGSSVNNVHYNYFRRRQFSMFGRH